MMPKRSLKPTGQELALLMSLAGVGLTIGGAAQAEGHRAVHARRIEAFGLPAPAVSADFCAPGGADAMLPEIRLLPVSESLPVVDEALVAAARTAFGTNDVDAVRFAVSSIPAESPSALSKADRDAIALAMVSDPDPGLISAVTPSSRREPPPFPNEPVTPGAVPAIAGRQPEDPPIPTERLVQSYTPRDRRQDVVLPVRESGRGFVAATADGPERVARGVGAPAVETVDALPVSTLDLDLDLSAAPIPNIGQNLSGSPVLDVNLDLAADLDIDLRHPKVGDVPLQAGWDPSAALDIDLAVGPSADLAVDLEPGLDFLLDLKSGRAWKAPSAPAAAPRAALAVPVVVAAAAPGNPPAVSRIATPNPSTAAPAKPPETVELSCVADQPTTTAQRVPQIVVATHSERVLRSLGALLAHEDPTALRFGAQTQETFATSHAEKTLLTLASLRDETRAPAVRAVDSPETSAGKPRHASQSPLGDGLVALNEGKLDRVRGGFQTPSGVQISFGIERAVYINGNLVTTTSLNVSDVGKVTTAQTTPAVAGTGLSSVVRDGTTVIQNGAGNVLLSGPVSAASLGTVVQNTLNNQKIQSVTMVNATVNSLQMLKAQSFQSSLRSALIDSLRR